MKKIMNYNIRSMIKYVAFFAIVLILIISCNTNKNKYGIIDETPTTGSIKIGVDESFKLLLDTEIYTFESLYKNANITALYKPEIDVINDFFNDSIRLMITTYQLTQEEKDNLLSTQRVVARSTTIAKDALAFIVNKNNPDSLLQLKTIEAVFKGEISEWKQINNKSELGKMKVVFDNVKSCNVRYFNDKYNLQGKVPDFFAAVDSNEAVITYVENHPDAIGVVSVNWISDRHDSISHSFLSRIQVVGITPEYDPEGSSYLKPYQGFIAEGSYPFIREVYVISRESFSGLGSGFISFIAGEKGQRIILKSKLVPSIMPVRLIQTK
jgi:phosphate transport system substrate-binding protein